MKQFLILFSLINLIVSCKKNSVPIQPQNQNTLISEAKNYFNKTLLPTTSFNQSSLRTQTAKTPQWDKASLLKFSIGQAVLVPLNYSKKLYLKSSLTNKLFEVSQLAQLLVYKDSSGTMQGEVITAFPDSNYLIHPSAKFTGILLVEDWSGNRLKQYKYDRYGMAISYPAGFSGSTVAIDKISPATVIAVCYEIEGYNYSEADPDDVYSWSESAGCDFYAASDESTANGSPSGGDYGSAAGGGVAAATSDLIVFSGTSPIANIQQNIKCFTNSSAADHIYTVTVCVAQPVPGTRTAWNFSGTGSSATGNPVNVGHTFLIFNETYGGSSIIRNIGFSILLPGVSKWVPNAF